MQPPDPMNPSAEVLARLDGVTDPELDESVTAMGFIQEIAVAGEEVAVTFRLPTFWCSANFAFLMAEDMKIAIETLPWVRRATVRLVDHFAARAINRGIAEGLPFEAVFTGEATAGLAMIRRTFRQKAFLGRQEALLDPLVRRDGREATLAMTLADLTELTCDADAEISHLAARYLAARRHDGGATDPAAPAFTTLDGTAVRADGYPTHLREIRRVRRAAQANAELCRLYLAARFTPETHGKETCR